MRLNQVTLAVRNMAECVPFYQQLGLTLIVDSAPRYVRFELPSGDTLSLHHEEDWQGANWPLVYFECDDIDAEYERLKGEGLVFESAPQDQSWLWRETDVLDPSGNRVRLYQAGENRRFPPWRVDAAKNHTEETRP